MGNPPKLDRSVANPHTDRGGASDTIKEGEGTDANDANGAGSTTTEAKDNEGSAGETSHDNAAGNTGASKDDGYEFGGSLTSTYTTVHGGRTPWGQTPTLHRGGLDFMGVWTNRGEGSIRSFDLNLRGDATTAEGAGTSPTGELNLGMNTENWRYTLSAGSQPNMRLPFMTRLGVERRPFDLDDDGDVRLGWNARLGYFRVDELPSFRNTETPPQDIFAAGAAMNLTTEHDLGGFHLSTNHELGLDLFARTAPRGAYRDEFVDGHDTWFPIDTAAGIGGIYLGGNTALSYDFDFGNGWLLRPMITHDFQMEFSDPTIAPHIARNALGAGARLYTPGNLSFSAALESDVRPTWDNNFDPHHYGVFTADWGLSDQFRLGALARIDGDGVHTAMGRFGWNITDGLTAFAAGGYQRNQNFWNDDGSAVFTAGLSWGFGGPRRQLRRDLFANALTGNVDPTRPFLDGRNEDRRYRARAVGTAHQPLEMNAISQTVRTYLSGEATTATPDPPTKTLEAQRVPASSGSEEITASPIDLRASEAEIEAPGFWRQVLDFLIELFTGLFIFDGVDTQTYDHKIDPEQWRHTGRLAARSGGRELRQYIHDRPEDLTRQEIVAELREHNGDAPQEQLENIAVAMLEGMKAPLPDEMTMAEIFRDIPADRGDLVVALLDHPGRVAGALNMDYEFPGRFALPGRLPPEHPDARTAHQWAAEVLRAHGYEARVVAIGVDDRPDSVVVYRKGPGELWHALYRDRLADLHADSPEEAVMWFTEGMGEGTVPNWAPRIPDNPTFNPSHEAGIARHDQVTTSTHSDTSALGNLDGLSYDQLVARIRTLAETDPAAALDAIQAMLGDSGPFEYQFHPDEISKFDPETFWEGRYGVCAEYHIFAARMMRQAGITAYPVELFSPGLAHVVTVYQDPTTGKWNVADYDTRHETNADSPEEALAAYDPSYYKMIFLEDDGGLPANRAVFFSPQAQAMREFMRRMR